MTNIRINKTLIIELGTIAAVILALDVLLPNSPGDTASSGTFTVRRSPSFYAYHFTNFFDE